MRSLKTTAIAITAAALLGTGAATAVASSGDSDTQTTSSAAEVQQTKQNQKHKKGHRAHAPKRDGAKRLCKRAPRIEKRIERRLHRLNGPVTRLGSINRLEKRLELARKADHDAVASYLGDRLKNRRALPHKLQERKKDLSKVQSWCKSHGHDGAKEGDSRTSGARS
jgi:hypothetical protein